MEDTLSEEQLTNFKKKLFDWITSCRETVNELNLVADDLDQHFNKISKAKVGGSATAIVGSILGIVGFGLSFVTFGASLGLTIAGGVIAGLGGVTVGGSVATDAILSRKRKKTAELIIQKYNEMSAEVKQECLDISSDLQEIVDQLNPDACMEETFPHWINFWWDLVIGTGQAGWGTGAKIIYTTIRSSFQLITAFDDAALSGLRIGGGVFRTLGTAGKSLHLIGGIASIVLLPFDIFTMVDSSIDVHKKNKHAVSSAIRTLAEKMEKDCPTESKIETMIEETLKDLNNANLRALNNNIKLLIP